MFILIIEVIGMAMVKKSITVTDQQDHWIKAQIEKGHYGNESEVVRELIRERQLREQGANREIEAIRAKLIQAEASGFTEQTPVEILNDIKNGLGRDAV
jgi:antitoxin ParD1/3/4